MAYALMAQCVTPWMVRAGGGAIVNMSSISAFIAQPNRWTYNAAKGAVHTLTKCMALDLARHKIRVNSVSPGWIWTREVEKAAGGDRQKWEPVWGQFHMLERLGEPVECAGPILFLLSEDASFITAADLPIDGGYQGLGSEGIGNASKFAGSE
jgi:NAD(P)-dependent dehydrogenase (short-subunit alcohol dehydrogenase family)